MPPEPVAEADPDRSMTFEPTPGDLIEAYRLSNRSLPPGVIAIGLVGGAAFGAWLALVERAPPVWVVGIFSGCLLGAIVPRLLWLWLYLPRVCRHLYKQQKSLHGPVFYAWDEDGMAARNATGAGKTPWANYAGYLDNAEILLLYHSDLLFVFVPKRGMTQPQSASLASCMSSVPAKGRGWFK